MDPWGFSAEEKLGHRRFVVSPAVKLSTKVKSHVDDEDALYMQSFPTILHIAELKKREELQRAANEFNDRRSILSSDVQTLLLGAVHPRRGLPHGGKAKKCAPEQNQISHNVQHSLGSATSPVFYSRQSEFPSIQLRRTLSPISTPTTTSKSIAPFSPETKDQDTAKRSPLLTKQSNDDEFFPVIKFPSEETSRKTSMSKTGPRASRRKSSSSMSSLTSACSHNSTSTDGSRQQKKRDLTSCFHPNKSSHVMHTGYQAKGNNSHLYGTSKFSTMDISRKGKAAPPRIYGSSCRSPLHKTSPIRMPSQHTRQTEREGGCRATTSPFGSPTRGKGNGVSVVVIEGPESVSAGSDCSAWSDGEGSTLSQQYLKSNKLYCT